MFAEHEQNFKYNVCVLGQRPIIEGIIYDSCNKNEWKLKSFNVMQVKNKLINKIHEDQTLQVTTCELLTLWR